MIKEIGITEEQFAKSCMDAEGKTENQRYLDIIFSADDFVKFKEMMVKRNMRLNEKAIKFILK